MKLKRDNWTNAEVIAIVEGLVLAVEGEKPLVDQDFASYNDGVRTVADYFREHFASPEDDFSALSYDIENNRIYHTGRVLPQ